MRLDSDSKEECGDATNWFSLTGKPETVKSFLQHALTDAKHAEEWGEIMVDGQRLVKYTYHNLHNPSPDPEEIIKKIPQEILEKVVISGSANGGWSAFNYYLETE